ncbi:SRPBCC family protein [Nitriliruptor alkaliphilus]|uniref:SRPBCC family protein n=1 Tax=Nitriliruptor alkaliphilus TaxID=427918 RepID=UPI000697B011|nr:SRPBCC family protein [Nitriliruptor alkaliphilus]
MQLEHRFTVPLGPDETYRTLLDLETVAACFPGAQLEEVTGDVFEGRVKVKLGPVTVLYRGQGTFVARDDEQRRVVIEARGRDNRGSSTAAATVTACVDAHADGAEVVVTTDLDVTGPPAQLAGGAMEGVSNRLLDRFVTELRRHVTGETTAAGVAAGADATRGAGRPAPSAAPTHVAGDGDDHLDLLGAVLGDDGRKLAVAGLVGLAVGALLRSMFRRRVIHVVVSDERRQRA